MNTWTKITDDPESLPNTADCVHISNGKRVPTVGAFYHNGRWLWADDCTDINPGLWNVTHWKPWPEPPGADNNG